MFERIFVEKDILESKPTQYILNQLSNIPVKEIQSYEDVFNKVKKPYLQKRESLNLFIAKKKGALVKQAPEAYGKKSEEHFYFVHAYNCIYECDYCYLQGYFHTPDIVLFVNYDEIMKEIEEKIIAANGKNIWFHAGEFSDSLALSHLTQEFEYFYNLFKKYPNAKLELRTKSSRVAQLLKMSPLDNIYVSFSMAPENKINAHEFKTARLKKRLESIQRVYEHGFPVALHFDPMMMTEDIVKDYSDLLNLIAEVLPLKDISYLSLGVVRFPDKIFQQVKNNYPESPFLHDNLIKSPDGKIKYPRAIRMWLLSQVKNLCIQMGMRENQIYFCMEEES